MKAPAFRHIILPLEFDPDRADAIDWRSEAGELLSPERFSREYWEGRFASMPVEVRSAQYNQIPMQAGLGLFKKEDFRYWSSWDDLPREGLWYASLDAALQGRPDKKGAEDRSYWVCQIWLKSAGLRVLLRQIRFRDDFAVALSTVTEFIQSFKTDLDIEKRSKPIKWNASRFIIEDKANGPAVISSWKAMGVPGGLTLEAVNPGTKSKLDRAEACLPTVRSGSVWLPSPAVEEKVGCKGLVERLCTFPRGKFDDEVDTLSQFLLFVMEERLNPELMLKNLKKLAKRY